MPEPEKPPLRRVVLVARSREVRDERAVLGASELRKSPAKVMASSPAAPDVAPSPASPQGASAAATAAKLFGDA